MVVLTCYISYLIAIFYGYFHELLFFLRLEKNPTLEEKGREVRIKNICVAKIQKCFYILKQGYTPIYDGFLRFHICHIYRRGKDCFNQPIASEPGGVVTIVEQVSHDNNLTFK